MENFFYSLDLYNKWTKQKINCCCTVKPKCKGMPGNFRRKTMKMKHDDRTSKAVT
jgi:hypothetical protein